MHYNGSPFGGIDVYRSLSERYGDSSLIAYSQFITDDLLKQYEEPIHFCERGTNPIKFVDKITTQMEGLRENQNCFLAMPFDKKHDPIFRLIRRAVEKQGFRCVRVDNQHFTDSIIQRILEGIRTAKIVIFVATDKNPNAFYEAGYAVALNKEMITITDDYSNLPFDVRDRNTIAYKNDHRKLESSLTARLANLTATTTKYV